MLEQVIIEKKKRKTAQRKKRRKGTLRINRKFEENEEEINSYIKKGRWNVDGTSETKKKKTGNEGKWG